MRVTTFRAIGICVLVAWLSALNLAVPLPASAIDQLRASYENKAQLTVKGDKKEPSETPNAAETQQQVKFVSKRIWIEWTLKVSLVIVGIIAGVLTIQAKPLWPLFVLSTSLLYVGGWLLHYASFELPITDAYFSYATAIANSGDVLLIIQFVQHHLLLPLFHFVMAVWLIQGNRGLS